MTAIKCFRSFLRLLLLLLASLIFIFIFTIVYVRGWQLYTNSGTDFLPEVVFVGEGPGTFTTPLDNFIIKKGPLNFVFEPGPTYVSQINERIWGVRGANGATPTIWDGEVNLGPVEAMCTARYVGIDDEPDGKRNAFYLNGEQIELINEGMVFSGSFMIPEDGELILDAQDSVGGWFLPCNYGVADFYASPIHGLSPLTVYFTNLSTGDFNQCQWDFGDESKLDSCEDPAHIYDSSGTYTVTLMVDGPGGSNTMTKSDYITVYEPVEAEFSATPTTGIKPLELDFTNLSTGDFDRCQWDFGDESKLDSCENPAHIYDSSGTFTVTLMVDGPGGSDTMIKPDYITVYEPVEAEFSATPTSGIQPLEVDFTNLSTGDFDYCLWDFGDGNSSDFCSNLSHIYDISGIFTITLTIDGPGGNNTVTKPDYIIVYEPVNAVFSASPKTGAPPLEVNFINLSTGDFQQCIWDFGDGETLTTCDNPKHKYRDEGNFSVSLTVKGLGGENTMAVDKCIKVTYYRSYLPSVLRLSQ